ncbi:MAG TPA: NFACT RNA binding domain-containing protein [Chryseolinea sp.]|nr:NFACT RNA binding domain-containing protein [Chryseolinea sp.]
MQNNYHFLRQLTRDLTTRLVGSVTSECYSQDKAELIVRFETTQGSFHLRANLSPAFTCLSFPRDFQRARKNSVDLFPDLLGHRVTGLTQHQHDRSFTLHLSNDLSLLFKLHGNRSNIILYSGSRLMDMFRTNLEADRELQPAQLDRTMDMSYETFSQNQERLSSLYFTFGKIPWLYLRDGGFANLDVRARWEAVQLLLAHMESPRYYITLLERKMTFSLLPVGEAWRIYDDPVLAVTEFYHRYRSREGFDEEYNRIATILKKKIGQAGDTLGRAQVRQASLEAYDKFKAWADLLMANLHVAASGDRIVLPNFYNHYEPEEIRLQPDISLQKNAAIYYSKSKKQQIEIKHLDALITQKQQELSLLREEQDALARMDDVKAIRLLAARHPVRADADETESLPFHENEFMGFRILVGRNAQANDTMLQRYGYKDDLWLHAKDVPGSHVLVKHQAGKVIPKPVIERAAQLAAWYSKRKTDTLCPVSVTQRKYVRKRKGDPPGAVVVERESVILVSPQS